MFLTHFWFWWVTLVSFFLNLFYFYIMIHGWYKFVVNCPSFIFVGFHFDTKIDALLYCMLSFYFWYRWIVGSSFIHHHSPVWIPLALPLWACSCSLFFMVSILLLPFAPLVNFISSIIKTCYFTRCLLLLRRPFPPLSLSSLSLYIYIHLYLNLIPLSLPSFSSSISVPFPHYPLTMSVCKFTMFVGDWQGNPKLRVNVRFIILYKCLYIILFLCVTFFKFYSSLQETKKKSLHSNTYLSYYFYNSSTCTGGNCECASYLQAFVLVKIMFYWL